MMAVQRGVLAAKFGILLMTVGVVAIMAGGIVLALQCVWWLKYGVWFPESVLRLWLAIGLPYPALSWAGAERIALSALDSSLSAGLVIIGVILAAVSTKIAP